MGTTDQPKPSEPKGIQPEQRPLQPGQTPVGDTTRETTPSRKNPQTPDSLGDNHGQEEEIRR